jgi:hypothetical protein
MLLLSSGLEICDFYLPINRIVNQILSQSIRLMIKLFEKSQDGNISLVANIKVFLFDAGELSRFGAPFYKQ